MTKHAIVSLSSLERIQWGSSGERLMTYPEPGNHSKPNRKNYTLRDKERTSRQGISSLFAKKDSRKNNPEAKTERGLAATSCFKDDRKYDLDNSLRDMGYGSGED